MAGVFEIKKNAVDHFFFVFRTSLTEAVAVSRSFPDRASMERCLSEIRSLGKLAAVVEENSAASGPCFRISPCSPAGWIFTLEGFSGEVIMASESFANRGDCLACLKALKEESLEAKTVDLS